MTKLYYAAGTCSLAAHIVAREAGVPLDLVAVELATHRLPDGSDYHVVNSRGYVPALELDDGTVLTEVAAIVQYLAELRPAAELVPGTGTLARAQVQSWLTFISSELHKPFSPWLWHNETADSTVQTVRAMLARRFDEIETRLAKQPYLMGERFSVVDAYAFAILQWTKLLHLDMTAYPEIRGYLARVGERPKVKEAIDAERRRLAA